MDENSRTMNRRFEIAAWGVFFIWLGVTSLFRFPDGAGTFGIGLILLGLNAARYFSHIPTSNLTIALGVLALVLGAFDIARAIFSLSIELPVFPILLIVLGAVMLWRELARRQAS
jgi:hypothetical protein